jgi:hypothetical protein
MKTFTPKDKKIVEYYPSHLINNINNPIFNEMIIKKKDYMGKRSNEEELNDIECI